ncbi:protein phosphatase 2C-like protein [Tamaricihabitans halophyticus]|uniref:Protein phosphatase 2C-like protein n=1 Tax=Tamaricihabitans halophyticus TaxID=1262583 RepID=A0A4R2Q8G9_9PSEU|nr:protein phosphatase 2C domain-containing protein [Tamaricihabitans halophyticus]TCP45127.1 protein phosphatase 2C-like protein [Tamaricihabitans halophyticus]
MPRIELAEQAGVDVRGASRPTEDRVVVLDNAVLVLDGATTLRAGLPSGGWYAEELSARLGAMLTAEPHADLAETLAKSIADLRDTHGLRPGAAPSSTVAMLRWQEQQLDALVLADSPIIAFHRDASWAALTDDRLGNLPRGPGGYRSRLRTGAGFGEEHLAAVTEGSRRTGSWRNVEGGFWVAEADPAAAHQARRASWPRATIDAVLLATDGVSCAVDDYGLYTWPQLLELARAEGPQSVLDAIRAAERADHTGARWPRPKLHDDQALALLTNW